MAEKKISGLTAAAALTGAELVELVQSAANAQSTVNALKAFILGGAFTPYTPTVTYGGGKTAWATASATARSKIIGNRCIMSGTVTVTTVGSAITCINCSAPAGVTFVGRSIGRGHNTTNSKGATVNAGYLDGTTLSIFMYDGTFPATTGQSLDFTVDAEII